MFDRNTPISRSDEDRFGRTALATRVAEVIANVEDEAGLVVGIHGESGSGKTSLLQLVRSDLQSRPNVLSVSFNPWMLEANPGPLVPAFFSTMRAAFRLEHRPALRRLDTLLRNYGAVCNASFPATVTSMSIADHDRGTGDAPQVSTVGHQIHEALDEAALLVVVFVDDVDRLTSLEMHTLLRLVKLLSNVRRMRFVLACDAVRVSASLDERFQTNRWADAAGAALLEKVVQVPIALPFPDDAALRSLTLDAVNSACLGAGILLTADEARRFDQRFERKLLRLVRTPRRARRYANSLALSLPLFERENGCIVEHLCREALQVLAPDAA